ncbi:MAG: B9 domain-containing protein [archaeon]|nr:B9 domain-containing protein [archaeon]
MEGGEGQGSTYGAQGSQAIEDSQQQGYPNMESQYQQNPNYDTQQQSNPNMDYQQQSNPNYDTQQQGTGFDNQQQTNPNLVSDTFGNSYSGGMQYSQQPGMTNPQGFGESTNLAGQVPAYPQGGESMGQPKGHFKTSQSQSGQQSMGGGIMKRKKRGDGSGVGGMSSSYKPGGGIGMIGTSEGSMSHGLLPKKTTLEPIPEVKIDGILVNVQGIIEKAEFESGDCFYAKYDIVSGVDWQIINGMNSGQSQQACQGENASNYFVWNFPFEIGYKTTNPSGWPQIVISIFGPDFLGREVVKAYGTCHIPTTPGSHVRTLQLFSPISSSIIIELLGYALGQKAEIINAPRVMSTGEGRELIRTQSEGAMTIRFNVQISNMEELGYNV